MASSYTRLRGFQDLYGPPARAFELIEEQARVLMKRYQIREIKIPVLERTELYQHTTGETSDIVQKQMYTFRDRDEGETLVALRPEGTPGVVRAYIEAGFDRSDPEQKFFYYGPMFRRERPQKGRYRQFYQFGVEVFGRADPACDAELLIMIEDLRQTLGLELRLELNSLGDEKCRPAYRQAVLEYGRAHLKELCEDCHERLERNPLRLLDCKKDVEVAKSAPKSIDYLCEECKAHLDGVLAILRDNEVAHTVNPMIVRGLDYYVRTAFEVVSGDVGSQSAVIAGGRYDGLVQAMGGAAVPGIGFAIGVDRLGLALETSGKLSEDHADIALAPIGEVAARRVSVLARALRHAGVRVEVLSSERSLKVSLKRADKLGVRHVAIVGEDELKRGVVQLRDLRASEQREISEKELAGAIRSAG